MVRISPLKISCMATMPPALTEAPSQPRATQNKLHYTSATTPGQATALESRNGPATPTSALAPQIKQEFPSRKPTPPVHTPVASPVARATMSPSGMNGSTQQTTVTHLGTVKNLNDLYHPKSPRMDLSTNTSSPKIVAAVSSSPSTSIISHLSGVDLSSIKQHIMSENNRLVMIPPPPQTHLSNGGSPVSSIKTSQQPKLISHLGILNTSPTSQSTRTATLVSRASLAPSPAAVHTPPTPLSSSSSIPMTSSPAFTLPEAVDDCDVDAACARRQVELGARCRHLLRRIRRLQSRQAISHVRQQLTTFVDHQHQHRDSSVSSSRSRVDRVSGLDLKTDLLQSDDVKNLSTAALVSLVRKLQSNQATAARNQRLAQGGKGLRTRLDSKFCAKLASVSGNLKTNLRHLESAIDTDATESSSGGESCDEAEVMDDDADQSLPLLQRRAEWQWAERRSFVASRWTWLQAQVSDLEYRIRQQSDIYRQIRATKGSVTLGDVTEVVTPGKDSTPTTSTTAAIPSDLPNGVIDRVQTPAADVTQTAARCRPLRSYRKRKLLRTYGLQQLSRKAARLSTVRCSCYPPVTPCALCSGRYNNTEAVDPAVLPPTECLALLDHSYHSVLSFDQEVALSHHFEKLLRSGDWQTSPSKSGKSGFERKENRLSATSGRVKRKYTKKLQKSASAAATARIKNKYDAAKTAAGLRNELLGDAEGGAGDANGNRSGPEGLKSRKGNTTFRSFDALRKRRLFGRNRPVGGSSTLSQLKERQERRRRGEQAYDIDNIVIPYSMAANTRVEKISYKEIDVPKWREMEIEAAKLVNAALNREQEMAPVTLVTPVEPALIVTETGEEIEDLSDFVFAQRHGKSEANEKLRYLNFTGQNPTPRRRGAQRADSDSAASRSRAGTPDSAQSPGGDPHSHMTSQQHALTQSLPAALTHNARDDLPSPRSRADSVSSTRSEEERRSRTTSGSECVPGARRRAEERKSSSALEVVYVDSGIPPWLKRTFPLDEDELRDLTRESSPPPRGRVAARIQAESCVTTEQEPSPCVSDTDSDGADADDPADPEWTVNEVDTKQDHLVLRLAKR